MEDYRQISAIFEGSAGLLGDPAVKSVDVGRPIFGHRVAAALLMAFINWTAVNTYLFFGWLWLLVLVAAFVTAIVRSESIQWQRWPSGSLRLAFFTICRYISLLLPARILGIYTGVLLQHI